MPLSKSYVVRWTDADVAGHDFVHRGAVGVVALKDLRPLGDGLRTGPCIHGFFPANNQNITSHVTDPLNQTLTISFLIWNFTCGVLSGQMIDKERIEAQCREFRLMGDVLRVNEAGQSGITLAAHVAFFAVVQNAIGIVQLCQLELYSHRVTRHLYEQRYNQRPSLFFERRKSRRHSPIQWTDLFCV